MRITSIVVYFSLLVLNTSLQAERYRAELRVQEMEFNFGGIAGGEEYSRSVTNVPIFIDYETNGPRGEWTVDNAFSSIQYDDPSPISISFSAQADGLMRNASVTQSADEKALVRFPFDASATFRFGGTNMAFPDPATQSNSAEFYPFWWSIGYWPSGGFHLSIDDSGRISDIEVLEEGWEAKYSQNGFAMTDFAIQSGVALRSTLEISPGDADSNGVVDFSDFLTLSANFGLADRRWSDGDFDNDGRVGFKDFLDLSGAFGQSSVPVESRVQAVPEPRSFYFVAAGGLILLGQRRTSRWTLFGQQPGRQ